MPIHSLVAHDVDEAAAAVRAHLFDDYRLVPVDEHRAFHGMLTVARAGPLTAGLVRYGCEVELSGVHPENAYSVTVPLDGVMRVASGSSAVIADAATAAILCPGQEATSRGWADGTERVLMVKFERDALEAELRRTIGRDVPGPIGFAMPLDLTQGAGRLWMELTRALVPELETGDGFAFNPLVSAQLASSVMSGLLLAADHPDRDALTAPPASSVRPAVIQRAVRIIEDRADEPLTVSSIAEEVGCSVRALQVGFRRHVDTTPREYLERIRMDRAHAELLGSSMETTTVGAVARRWGFAHVGRFAAAYRTAYGVAPSATLRDR